MPVFRFLLVGYTFSSPTDGSGHAKRGESLDPAESKRRPGSVRPDRNVLSSEGLCVPFSMTGSLQESEDIAQEAFLTAWNKLNDLHEPDKIGPWLCAIARSLCQKWFRRNRRDPLHAAASLDQLGVVSTPLEETLHEKRRKQADLAWTVIAEIPEQYREPMVLYYRDGCSVREVAETLELTETCVKQRLHRGRQYLKQELERLVATALESTRPDTAFTLAVLASLPLAATTGCATTTVSAVGGETLGKGAGFAGSGFVWILASAYLLISAFALVIFGTIIGYKQMLAVIRHSPGLRSRRLVLANSLWKTAVTASSLIGGIFLLLPARSSWLGLETRGIALVVLILANLVLFRLWENRFVVMWRKAATEDLMNESGSSTNRLSARNLYVPFFVALFVIVGLMACLLGTIWHRGSAHGFDFAAIRIGVSSLFLLFAVLAFIEYFRQGMKLASEAGLISDPPPSFDVLAQISGKRDLLEYFLGIPGNPEASLKSGFYSETIMMGALIVFSSLTPISVGLRQPDPWPVYAVIAAASFGFLIFTKCVAGKPPVRHLGWMVTCLFFLAFFSVIDGVVLQEAIAKYPASKNQTMYLTMFLGGFGFSFYTIIATLAWLFRKNHGQ